MRSATIGRRSLALAIGLIALALGTSLLAQPAPITVAAVSDLKGVLPEIAAQFERQTRRPRAGYVRLVRQFFARRSRTGRRLTSTCRRISIAHAGSSEAALAEPGSLYQCSDRRDRGLDDEVIGSRHHERSDCVEFPAVRRVAIANPEHAPYGRAAVAAMRRAGLYDTVKSKLVFGENISQAAYSSFKPAALTSASSPNLFL